MKSCIFEGQVKHSRTTPVKHDFKYQLFMMFLDLAELKDVFDGRLFWSVGGLGIAQFRRKDHFGDPEQPLHESVRDLVEKNTGQRPKGPIRLLTQLSYFGYGFSPVCFYYCFDSSGTTVQTIIVEVNNTPWGEQHCYVLTDPSEVKKNSIKCFELSKEFHVSPFMEMGLVYKWTFSDPSKILFIHMENFKNENKLFEATLRLKRTEINGRSLCRLLIVYPLITVRLVVGIYWQALRLWLKKCPVYAHPAKSKNMTFK
ncbi:MAG: chromosome partitioning protein ParA [Rhodospirillaceae bacterium]|nr:chromosome partitioning protein ParA [Rhodospirillaceae bacterium]